MAEHSDKYWHFLLNTKYYFLYIPIIVGVLGFVETVWVLGTFIPMEIISISGFALLHEDLFLFSSCVITFGLGIYLWLIEWYFIWKKYWNKFILKLENKYPVVKWYFKEMDNYIDKYHIWAFPILINLWLIRPFISIYFGSRAYDFKKYVAWCVMATVIYVIPRALIWYFVWIFGKVVFSYFKIWYKYLLYVLLGLIVLAFIADLFIAKNEIDNEWKEKEDFWKKILKKK